MAAPHSQAYSEDWMLRCFSENVDKRRQNILYADNLGGRPPTRPSAPDRDLPFVLQEVHDLLIELLQSVPRSSIDFHVELDLLFQPPLLERPILSAPPGGGGGGGGGAGGGGAVVGAVAVAPLLSPASPSHPSPTANGPFTAPPGSGPSLSPTSPASRTPPFARGPLTWWPLSWATPSPSP